jgi:hypothetical protein
VKSPLLGWNQAAVSLCKDALFFDFQKKNSVSPFYLCCLKSPEAAEHPIRKRVFP